MKNPFDLKALSTLNFEGLLKITDCIKVGHTNFYNGQHGNGWVDISNSMKFPAILDLFTKKQAEFIKEKLPNINLIVSPAVSGSLVGSSVAKHLDAEFAVTLGKGSDISFHRRYSPNKNQAVCIVEDMIFSGTDIEANIEFLRNQGFKEIYVCCWINRRENEIDGVQILSLANSLFEKYEKDSCPLCKKSEKLDFEWVRE